MKEKKDVSTAGEAHTGPIFFVTDDSADII